MRKSPLQGPVRVMVVCEQPLANLVALTLNHGAYLTKTVTEARGAGESIRDWQPQLLLVDIDIERTETIELIGPRVGSRRLPTIAFTARGDLKTKLAAFDHGADDIVTIPFVPEELIARVLALMRRTYGDAIPFVPVINVGGLEIDVLNQRVKSGTSLLHLTSIEQALLYLLASHPGEVLGRETILDTLWGTDYVAESNVVDRHVRNLRVKLKNSWRQPRYIGTVPGKGYRFLATP